MMVCELGWEIEMVKGLYYDLNKYADVSHRGAALASDVSTIRSVSPLLYITLILSQHCNRVIVTLRSSCLTRHLV